MKEMATHNHLPQVLIKSESSPYKFQSDGVTAKCGRCKRLFHRNEIVAHYKKCLDAILVPLPLKITKKPKKGNKNSKTEGRIGLGLASCMEAKVKKVKSGRLKTQCQHCSEMVRQDKVNMHLEQMHPKQYDEHMMQTNKSYRLRRLFGPDEIEKFKKDVFDYKCLVVSGGGFGVGKGKKR